MVVFKNILTVHLRPLKMMKNAFYLLLKNFLFSRYLNFCLDFLLMQENGFIKIYGVTTWLRNNFDQYLKKKRQSGNEIWSVDIL